MLSWRGNGPAVRGGRPPNRRRAAVLLAGFLALGVLAAPADALIVHGRHGSKLSVLPAIRGAGPASDPTVRASPAACSQTCSALVYHNNAPVQHVEKTYLFFWSPSGHGLPGTYRLGLENFLSEVAASDFTGGNPFSVAQQYYDHSGPHGAKHFAAYAISNAGMIVDTHPYPASGCSDTDANSNPIPVCLTQQQIETELASYVAAHRLPGGLGVAYYVLTPNGVGSCFASSSPSSACSYTGYCAWHSSKGTGNGALLYADIPWAYRVSGCDTDLAFSTGYPNGDAIDPAVALLGREISQTMTDPELNAWYDGLGNEIGDKCSYEYGAGGFGSTAGLHNNGLGYYNVTLGSDVYLLDEEFDNHVQDCSPSSSFTQPRMTLRPGSAKHHVPRTFTAHVTDPYGVAYVTWNFGDGTGTFRTTGTTRVHRYAKSGHRELIVIVTDRRGNTKLVVRSIRVS